MVNQITVNQQFFLDDLIGIHIRGKQIFWTIIKHVAHLKLPVFLTLISPLARSTTGEKKCDSSGRLRTSMRNKYIRSGPPSKSGNSILLSRLLFIFTNHCYSITQRPKNILCKRKKINSFLTSAPFHFWMWKYLELLSAKFLSY